jgi:hypothetical protein
VCARRASATGLHKGAVGGRNADLEAVGHDEARLQVRFVLHLGMGAQGGVEGGQCFGFGVVGQIGRIFDGQVGHGIVSLKG